jgi:hypothetical protein
MMNVFTRYGYKRSSRFGQSLIDYVFILGTVAVVFIAMNQYMRRGIQGVMRAASDELGSQEGGKAIVKRR